MPAGITDRPADVWEPLIAIADDAGGAGPNEHAQAAVVLNESELERDPSSACMLLADCRRVFTGHDVTG